jgi:cyclopropane-fatty-acyl-phospholipid synthase
MVTRYVAVVPESILYGPAYGALQYIIRSSHPLDPEDTWQRITGRLGPVQDWIRWHWPPQFSRPWLLAAKLRQDHVLGIADHYDVGNEFYELFLDKKYMFYTCADFPTGEETLEEAQTLKANFLLNLLRPQAGERILELGCGWGSMLQRIYEETGDRENLHGYTISQKQVEYNRAHHGFHVEFRNFITTDYPESRFDKIYSIGAWEHVRPHEVPRVTAKLYGALKPGGLVLHHFFCRPNEALPSTALVAQIFFPGSILSSYRHQMRSFEAAGFRILHQSIHDYRDTLRTWFDRLVENRDRALELVGVRTYNRYLVFFAAAWRLFHEAVAILVRVLMVKPAEGSAAKEGAQR